MNPSILPSFPWASLGRRLVSPACCALLLAGCLPAASSEGEGEGEAPAEGEGEGEGPACDDASLGGFELAEGYEVIESAALPTNITLAASTQPANGPAHLLGMGADLQVYDLGEYPALAASPAALFGALASADGDLAPGTEAFPSFLVAGAGRAASGYTRLSDFGGAVGTWAMGGATAEYLDAPANFAAAMRGDVLIVNGAGLGAQQGGLALYALGTGEPLKLAALGGDAVASGYVAATRSGALVVGQFTSENELYALGPAAVDAVLGGGPALELGSAPAFLRGGFGAVAGFGDGVAVVTIDEATWVSTGVVEVALAVAAGEVTPGAPAPVLQLREGCTTTLPFLSAIGDDVLVGIADASGTRAVRIRRQ